MATIQVRIDDNDKKEAEKVLHSIGIDMTTLVRALVKRVARKREVPFPLEDRFTVNGFTAEFEQEVLKTEHENNWSSAFDTTKTAIDWLHADDSAEDSCI